uniref:Uncharacterized protein n=1 Tax=Xiphophorus couchianus TaxID=32473 RepID=A0A3B5MZH6_9TELE
FTFITECKDPKACTILLRGASKEILAVRAAAHLLYQPGRLVRFVTVSAMAVSKHLTERSRALTGVEQWPYRAVAQALEVIPRTLIQNCGASTIRVLTSLRVKRSELRPDQNQYRHWCSLLSTLTILSCDKQTAILLLRIDDIVSGHKKKNKDEQMGGQGAE